VIKKRRHEREVKEKESFKDTNTENVYGWGWRKGVTRKSTFFYLLG